MENLKEQVDKKIMDIFSAGYKAHYILKKVLRDDTLFLDNKDIVDLIFIQREEINSSDLKSEAYSPAKLLIATSYGLLILEEGFKEISESYQGYRLKKIYYEKIDSIELDICLLKGSFKIFTGGNENSVIEFETSKYFNQFEKFIAVIHENLMLNK